MMIRTTNDFQNITSSPNIPYSSLSITSIKIISAFVMLITIMISIYLPIIVILKFQKSSYNSGNSQLTFKKWTSRLSCFAAGVFLSTGLMHIYPETLESIELAERKMNLKLKFPLGSFFTLIGFLLILGIEQGVMIYKHRKTEVTPSKKAKLSTINREFTQKPDVSTESSVMGSMDPIVTPDNSNEQTSQYSVDLERNNGNVLRSTEFEPAQHGHAQHNHFSELSMAEEGIIDSARILGLMGAMSIHTIFEGLAVGMVKTTAEVISLLITLSFHKIVVAASLGLSLMTTPSGSISKWIKYVGAPMVFSLGSPIGIGIGCLVLMAQNDGHIGFFMVGGALQGLACGTFLYVVFSEILPHELGHSSGHSDRPIKLLCLVIGFAFVCIYSYLAPES